MHSIDQLKTEIAWADHIIVGIGSGMSSSAGYNHYHWSDYFDQHLKSYRDYYGMKSPFEGFYYLFNDYESQWAYYAAYIHAQMTAPIGEAYLDLQKILEGRSYFILTTNIDGQISRVFDSHDICLFQGDFGYMQCAQPCHDEIYSVHEMITEMVEKTKDLRIPSALVPRCPHCGRVMVPWVRDNTFLQGEAWKESVHRYQTYVEGVVREGKHVLLLELGVGDMTPAVIQLPFWDLTQRNQNVHYARVNLQPGSIPEQIKERTVYIQGDIHEVLSSLTEKG